MVLCDIEGLSYEEIADTLGVKLGTVRSRIHRGRAQLRTALDHRRPRRPGIAAKVVTPAVGPRRDPRGREPCGRDSRSREPCGRTPPASPPRPAAAAAVAAAEETAAVPLAGDL